MLTVEGELHARALILGSYAEVCADGGIRALVYAHRLDQLCPDIVRDGLGDDSRFFRPELLDHHENYPPILSVPAAVEAAFAGEELFLPGVEERFPERLVLRRDSA